jgi:hypothetical protein
VLLSLHPRADSTYTPLVEQFLTLIRDVARDIDTAADR